MTKRGGRTTDSPALRAPGVSREGGPAPAGNGGALTTESRTAGGTQHRPTTKAAQSTKAARSTGSAGSRDGAAKPLRADAERNRQAIVCAAGTVFAREGTAVTLEHIAEAAGVGVGTIYRRFSSVDELVAVVLEAKMTRYANRTEEAAENALTEPWQAFADYVMFMLEQQATDLAFSEIVLNPATGTALFRSEIRRAFAASLVLVDRVKEAGAVGSDFEHADLYLLLNANAGLIRGLGASTPDAWRRFGAYMLQAFRRSTGLTPET